MGRGKKQIQDVEVFSNRLNQLFETARRQDGKRFTQEEVVRGSKGTLSRVYLWKLRTGRAKNPSMRVVQALADSFGVSVDFFTCPEGGSDIDQSSRVDDPVVAQICEKYCQLDAQGRRVILNLADYLISLKA